MKVSVELAPTLLEEPLDLIERQTPYLDCAKSGQGNGAITSHFDLIAFLHTAPEQNIEIIPWTNDVVRADRDIDHRRKGRWRTGEQIVAKLAQRTSPIWHIAREKSLDG